MAALSPQPAGPQNGDGESIIQLLEHFKDDDGRVALLVRELQELSNRVQVAELATVDPRLATASRRGSAGDTSGPSCRRGSSPTGERHHGAEAFADAVERVRQQMHGKYGRRRQLPDGAGQQGGGGGDGGGGGGGGGAGGDNHNQPVAAGRVEEAVLPELPADTSQPLPLPPGGHEWEALQAAVNDSVAAFGAAAAKMGWKKWALTRAHSALLVSLFWWVVAAAFRPEHPLSRPLQNFAFGHFCRHYVTVVLRLRGRARDQYQQVWIEMMAAAALYLLAEVFPRSQHKFDDGLRALITKQLRLWTAGALPADMHPSAHADAHDAAPAAFSVAEMAAAAAAAAAATSHPSGGCYRISTVAPMLGSSLSQLPPPSQPQQREQQLGKPAVLQPPVTSEALGKDSFLSVVNSGGTVRRASSGRASGSVGAGSTGAAATGMTSGAAGHGNGSLSSPGGGGSTGDGGGHGGPQAFVFTKNSPVMAQMLLGAGSGGAAGTGTNSCGAGAGAALAAEGGALTAPPIIKGLLKNTVGGTLSRFHRALDEASDEELSYSRLAAAATASASDAVAAYEARKRSAAAEAAAMRRGLVEARGAIEARQRVALTGGSGQVKQISDRLSGYIQNDVDRLMAGQPTSTEPATGVDAPRYLRPTAAAGHRGGGAPGEPPSVKPARLMAPLYEMRRVEGNIRAALAGGRHSSTDTVARVTAVTAAREAAAAADWRPLAQYPVGTKDTRRRKMAAQILYGLDLEQYAL